MKLVLTIAVLAALSGVTSKADTNQDQAVSDLPNFYEVDKGEVYRGGVPTNAGIQKLKEMKIQTVLNIRSEDPKRTAEEGKLVTQLGMKFLSVPLSGFLPPEDSDMDAIEKALIDTANRPIFVHCTLGQDRTGLAIALYRVFAQRVSPKEAYQEMMDRGFHRLLFGLSHYFEEKTGYEDATLQFVNTY